MLTLNFSFADGWEDRWVQSEHKDDLGKFKLSAGKFYGDAEKDKGELKLLTDDCLSLWFLKWYSVIVYQKKKPAPVKITVSSKVLTIGHWMMFENVKF